MWIWIYCKVRRREVTISCTWWSLITLRCFWGNCHFLYWLARCICNLTGVVTHWVDPSKSGAGVVKERRRRSHTHPFPHITSLVSDRRSQSPGWLRPSKQGRCRCVVKEREGRWSPASTATKHDLSHAVVIRPFVQLFHFAQYCNNLILSE